MNLVFAFIAWTVLFLMAWDTWTAILDSVKTARKMHRIPCANCQFFTNSPYLKCPVQPFIALTEEAAYCGDYFPQNQKAV